MKSTKPLLSALLAPLVLTGLAFVAMSSAALPCATPVQAQETANVQDPDYSALAPFLDSLLVAHGVPGASFAVFNDEGVLFEYVTGVKSLATGEPVDSETTFEGASISKPLFAHVVHTLAWEGALDLDASLTTLVDPIPEVAYDPRSALLTPTLLMTHQGGLPNWRARLNLSASSWDDMFTGGDTLRFVADPETGYRYSGEGYVLLQRVVEEITGMGLVELGWERVLEPLGMTHSSFVFDDRMRQNYARGHNREGTPDKWSISLPLASSTIQTTATDLARFGTHMASQLRIDGPYAALATPAVLVGEEGDEAEHELHWGPGFGIASLGERDYVYHGGNNVIFIADLIYGVEENVGYALLTNSMVGQRVVNAMEERIFGRRVRR